jgi:two-component system nitrate/nitrite response regulator NarL
MIVTTRWLVPNRPVNLRARRTRIFLISEHAIYRAGLRRLLERERDFIVVGAAANLTAALERVPPRRPDVTVVDLGASVLPDSEMLRRFSAIPSAARVLVLAPHVALSAVPEILRRGVRGIVTHATPPELFIKSIRTVASGQYWVGEKAVDDVVATLARAPARSGRRSSDGIRLTRRELDIVSLLMSGCPNKRIADECAIGQRTVKHHLTNVFGKLGVSNRLELVVFAIQHQLVVTGHSASARRRSDLRPIAPVGLKGY